MAVLTWSMPAFPKSFKKIGTNRFPKPVEKQESARTGHPHGIILRKDHSTKKPDGHPPSEVGGPLYPASGENKIPPADPSPNGFSPSKVPREVLYICRFARSESFQRPNRKVCPEPRPFRPGELFPFP